MKRIFITGGAGYVGAKLTYELLKDGYEVTVFDWMLFEPNLFSDITNNKNFNLIKGDLRDRKLLEKAIKNNDAVIHLACLSNDPSCEIDASLTKSINLDASIDLIKIAKENNIKLFINASSASVYGIKEEENVTEECKLEPITLYAKYKVEVERFLNSQIDNNFAGVSIRPATLCGYSLRQRLDLTVNILTYQAIVNGKITVFGGEQKRPNLSISDMVDIYKLLLKTPIKKINGQVFNAGFENYKVIEIAEIVRETLMQPVDIEVTPSNDHRSYHINSSKITKELNYTPKHNIRDAIKELKDAITRGDLHDVSDDRYRNVNYLLKRKNELELERV
ncbi:NAD-dependent epimerase/dehydratase family protein [Cytobacillus pseudoceanisediminis]|uniref:NAD-dependent epimerase/dehydratase family protein n=1 Tax=Cytobacillus pseudoceanisediminis TaxID=3051614 RepID=UPI00365407D2